MKYLAFTLLCLAGCSPLSTGELGTGERSTGEVADYYAIFSSLLGINEDRFTYTDSEGRQQPDALKLFKQLEEIYMRNIEPQEEGAYSREQAKVIMFFAFYAKNRNSGALSEYLASDLHPIVAKNSVMFLELMGELPFLIPSVCDRLNAFFGFEGKHTAGKTDFVRNYSAQAEKYLAKDQAEICLAQFD